VWRELGRAWREGWVTDERSRVHGKVLALMTAICFGLNPVLLKLGFARKGRSDVAVVIGLAITVPLYLLIAPWVGGISFAHLTIPALIGFVLGGLFGGGIGRRWMYLAIDRIGASPATAIKNSAPVITTALAILVLGEHVTVLHWLAIAAIVAGITLVTWQRGLGLRQLLSIGVLAALGSALSYGIRPLFLKYGLDRANIPLTGALIGAVAALIYAAALTPSDQLRFGLRERSLTLFAMSGVLQALGFLALTFGLSGDDVSIVYPVTSTAPLFTLLFTALMLRNTERLTWRIVAGAVAITAGVIVL
jgi:DME family drug/metabolite transporter